MVSSFSSGSLLAPCLQVLERANLNQYLPEESLLQPLWDYLRHRHQDSLRSPLFPVIFSISAYFSFCAAFMALDLLALRCPAINSYRIHPEQPVTRDKLLKTLGLTCYNHLVFILPAATAQWYWRPPIPLPAEAPALSELLVGMLSCTILFDFQCYIWHLLHHRIRWLYTTFHAVHHEYCEPFSWVTQCLSAWELISVGFWTTLDPLLLQCHCLTAWAFMLVNIFISVDDHCGYDFSWSLHNLVPLRLFGGSLKHDAHHQKPATNFAPFFSHWDWIFGTHSKNKHSPAVMAGKKGRGHHPSGTLTHSAG
uniref:cholesterol 25-hydroxylase-like protein 2 n=1 Tax=Pristiophorus japonicus TaxID=55135 RepID=UPI00398E4E0D